MPRPWLLSAIVILLTPVAVSAQVVINEIAAFEQTDHEWIEIYNIGPGPIDLTGWKFWENATNHGLTALQGSLSLSPGGYAIIAQKGDVFLADRTSFTGTVIDSSWGTLKESGEEIGLKDAGGNFVEQFTYLPAPTTALERKNAALADYSAANWQPHVSGGTPGLPNSNSGATTPPPPDPIPEPTPALTEDPIASTESPVTDETVPAASDPLPITHVFGRTVLINEFLTDPASGSDEWVELYNAGSLPAKLDGWKLMEGAGSKRTLTGELAAGAFLIVNPGGSLNDAGDHIVLMDDDNVVVNEISYGDWDDGSPSNNAPAAEENVAVARRQDGRTTGSDASDFAVTATATPRQPNRITAPAAPAPTPQQQSAAPPPPSPAPSPMPTPRPSPRMVPTPTPAPAVTPKPVTSGGTGTTLTFDPTPPTAEEKARRLPNPTPTPPPRPRVKGSQRIATVLEATAAAAETTMTVTGIVIALPAQLGKQIFYLADETGGIQIYQHQSSFPELALGDTVEVSGRTSRSRGEPRIIAANADAIAVLGHGEPAAANQRRITELTATTTGILISLEGEVTDAGGTGLTFDDGSGEITATLWYGASPETAPAIGSHGTISGILLGGEENRRLRPRGPFDLIFQTPVAVADVTTGGTVQTPPTPAADYRYVAATAVAAALGTGGVVWSRRRKRRPTLPSK